MIKLKVDTVSVTDIDQFIEVSEYKTKHTNTGEHICAIGVLFKAIMENDDDMTLDRLCELIRNNYIEELKENNEKLEGDDDY